MYSILFADLTKHFAYYPLMFYNQSNRTVPFLKMKVCITFKLPQMEMGRVRKTRM